jgi:hypothetical protein
LKEVDRDKLDSKSKKCMFISYGSKEMGYRLWNYEDQKVIRSKNVTVNGTEMYMDRKSSGSKMVNEYVELEESEKGKEVETKVPVNIHVNGDDPSSNVSSRTDQDDESFDDEETVNSEHSIPVPDDSTIPPVQLRSAPESPDHNQDSHHSSITYCWLKMLNLRAMMKLRGWKIHYNGNQQ